LTTRSTAEKLLIKPKTTVWISHPQHLDLIEPMPEGARVVDRPEQAMIAIVFGDDVQSLRNVVAAQGDRLAHPVTLWVTYPKGNRTDINRDSLWSILAEHTLRPIGQISLGDAWSAMGFRPLKPGEHCSGADRSHTHRSR
jgi:hypothetical protein